MSDVCEHGSLRRQCDRCEMQARIAELERELAGALAWTADDQPLPEDDAIRAAHPCETDRHDLYADAMRLVGAKRSKGALVDLVNWLLATRGHAERDRLREALVRYGQHDGSCLNGITGTCRCGLDDALRAALRGEEE